MQNMVLVVSIGLSMLALVLLMPTSRRRTSRSTQLALGLFVGGLAAAVALVTRADLIPDDVELTLIAAWVIAAGGLLTMLALTRR